MEAIEKEIKKSIKEAEGKVRFFAKWLKEAEKDLDLKQRALFEYKNK